MKQSDFILYNKKIIGYKFGNKKNSKLNFQKKNLIENKENIDNNVANNQIDQDDLVSTEFCLDEIKLKVDYDKIEDELKRLKNNNIENEVKFSINTNSQFDGDLFYYSEEEENKQKNIVPDNNIRNLNENIINNKNEKLPIDLEKIEYGIDENGNPIIIKEFNEEICKNSKCINNNLIAYIIPSPNLNENKNNFLVDLQGKIIQPYENGDFIYFFNNKKIIIQNFDVQNPKLRIFGARQRYSSLCCDLEINSQKKQYKFQNNNKLNKKGTEEEIITSFNKRTILNNKNKKINNFYFIGKTANNTSKVKYKMNTFNCFHKSRSKNDIIEQTKDILKKKESKNLIINNNKNILRLKNAYLNNIKNGSKKPTENENIKTEINNENFFPLKKIFNNRLKMDLKLKGSNKNNLLKNNNSINLHNINFNHFKFINKNNPLLNNSAKNIFKHSFSFFLNEKINKKCNPLLKKNKSPKIRIESTIKDITNIKNKIKKSEKKFIINNKAFNKNIKNIENNRNVDLKISNSTNNSNKYPQIEIQKKNIKLKTFHYNNQIELNKKYKISKSPEKTICNKSSRYSVLSKQADEMIRNYSKNKLINKSNINYINKEGYKENKSNKNKENKICINKSNMNSMRNSPKNNMKKNKILYPCFI